jgi:hypothetical protein
MPETETLLTVDFRANGNKARLTLTHEKHASGELRDDHRDGWTGSFDKLERLIARS